MKKINKESLIKRANQLKEQSGREPEYPGEKPEIAGTAAVIIKAICEQDNITPFIAEYALKMASDIIRDEMQHQLIQ